MNGFKDLRKVPINTLTVQEITGRMAHISDTMVDMAREVDELRKMHDALVAELSTRDKGNKNVTNPSGSNSSRN